MVRKLSYWTRAPKDGLFVAVAEDAFYRAASTVTGQPVGASWTPWRVSLVRASEDGKPWLPTDWPFSPSHLPIVSPLVARVVKDAVGEGVELLPVCVDGEDWYVLNVLRREDCVDFESSEGVLRDSLDGSVLAVRRLAIRPGTNFVGAARIAGWTFGPIVFSSSVARAILESGASNVPLMELGFSQ